MQLTLWGEQLPKRRSRKKPHSVISTEPYSITDNDCEILGHTLREWDLAGCSVCIDCHISIFCPDCTNAHPTDANAIPLCCPLHEERTVSA
jgi:hypothetical protein